MRRFIITAVRRKRDSQCASGKFLANSFEASFGFMFALTGLILVVSGLNLRVSPVMSGLNPIIMGFWAMQLLIAGPLIVVGLFWPWEPGMGRAVERAGLWMGLTAWATYVIVLVSLSPTGIIGMLWSSAIMAGCAGRLIALARIEREVSRAVRGDDL